MYKTIVVHVDGSPRQPSRLRASAELASQHGAHLVGSAATGMAWIDFALLTGAMAAPVPVADFEALRAEGQRHLDGFAEQAARLGVDSIEGRLVDDNAAHALLAQSRHADLVVLSQDSGGGGLLVQVRHLPEQLVLRGVRPVLVVPPGYAGAPIPGPVVAGWDGGPQAMRAISAALPLLQQAPLVTLALLNPDAEPGLHGADAGAPPGADMARYLARHGLRVEVVVERSNATVGDFLVDLAAARGAGLVVAGAYGHSRYREWILGGATRELLERAPVPLLLAH